MGFVGCNKVPFRVEDLGFKVQGSGLRGLGWFRVGCSAQGFKAFSTALLQLWNTICTIKPQLQKIPLKPGKSDESPCPQRAQHPLIKEYSLNHNVKPYII